MRHRPLIYAVIAAAAISGNVTEARVPAASNDSIAKATRLDALRKKREKLQNEIKTQDARRNREMAGVSRKRIEEMNNRQDSLCLALRSQLTDVILEIRELSPDVNPDALLQQYNNLINSKKQKQ